MGYKQSKGENNMLNMFFESNNYNKGLYKSKYEIS